MHKNYPSPKDEDNLKFRNNESQLIVNCANNHPITSLFRGHLYEINEQKRDVYKKYYEPYNKRFIVRQRTNQNRVIVYADMFCSLNYVEDQDGRSWSRNIIVK